MRVDVVGRFVPAGRSEHGARFGKPSFDLLERQRTVGDQHDNHFAKQARQCQEFFLGFDLRCVQRTTPLLLVKPLHTTCMAERPEGPVTGLR